ncbi:YpmP family protein [Cytobacillus spongiae]|uniref:DUF2535 family protein n=1 Tax=Cytobacillus spongiae TaxID=2901381 RepID=UPI001F3B6D37|nr:DUF2535 family protein [Cytobacillus spongiae]UII54508.1 YpmP family protein [Cytobacillus spongiae]
MLFKSLEFKNVVGQKVKVIEIPVLEEDSPYNFLIQVRLQSFITILYKEHRAKTCYSFKEHLKRAIKWPVYEELFNKIEIKDHNA